MKLRPFFDPDAYPFSLDKFEHLGIAFGLTLVLSPIFGAWGAMFLTIFGAAGFEFGQWDIARQWTLTQTYADGKFTAFRPGFGFGVIDLLASFAGAFVAAFIVTLF